MSNALIVLVRRKKITDAERQAAMEALQKLSPKIAYEMASIAFQKISDLAMKYTLSAYDATYLELALRKKLPLACKDGALREASKRCGVRVI